ncbi:hypothetical protein L6260_02820, partial [Candidatus Parcubacteria bacterium]|nr:hypothetical protein [Candidatus Parcubacteria bacterium]
MRVRFPPRPPLYSISLVEFVINNFIDSCGVKYINVVLKQLYFIQGKRRNAIILFYGLKCRLYESKKQRVCP